MTSQPPATLTTQYPDTEEGVLACLLANSTFSTLELEGATCTPDPQVLGVWLLTLADHAHPGPDDPVQVIVYLAGYPTPWGELRTLNDFECLY